MNGKESIKRFRKRFKDFSIGQKLRGIFLFLSVLVIIIYLVLMVGEFINDAIYRYGDEDVIPFLVRGLLIVAGISYFFKKNKVVKWIFYISWILAVFLFAGLLIDDNDNIWREREHERTGYYEKLNEEFLEGCEYCKNNYCDVKVKKKCKSNGISL